ncbi:MAG: DMT family transporter [Pseudomonadales bacterium]|nr:DMT family transporter [Pseudomonadales bacterium]
MSRQGWAWLFAGTTVLFWSTVATACKLSLRYLDIFQLLFYACLTSVVVLLLALSVRGELAGLIPAFRRHWRLTLIAGVLNPFMYYLILFKAYDLLPAQVAQPINYTWAIMLTIMSIVFLRQRITVTDVLAGLICYTGVVVIASQGDWSAFRLHDPLGVVLALISTIIWATYWLLNIRDPREPTTALCLNFLAALPLTTAACLIFSDPWNVSRWGLLGGAYVGLFEMGLAFLLWSRALKLSENTSRVSNLIFLAPFLSLWFIHQILVETLYLTTWAGLVLIVAGLVLQQFGAHRSVTPVRE